MSQVEHEQRWLVPLTEAQWDELVGAVGYTDQNTLVGPGENAAANERARGYDAAWQNRKPVEAKSIDLAAVRCPECEGPVDGVTIVGGGQPATFKCANGHEFDEFEMGTARCLI